MPQASRPRGHSPGANTFTRRAPTSGLSFNAKTLTFSAVVATGTPVLRRDAMGDEYLEILSISESAIRLDRFRSGAAPLLDSHRSASISDQIGIVSGARIENGELLADVRLSPRAGDVAIDLAGGAPPSVSVGYRVFAATKSRGTDGRSIVTVTDWEPFEVSLVAIPADPAAHIRNQPGDYSMDHEEILDDNSSDAEAGNSRSNRGNDVEHPTRMMSTRDANEAYAIASRAGLSAESVRGRIERGQTLEQVRIAAFDHMAAAADRTVTSNVTSSDATFDNPDFHNRTIEDALYARMSGTPATGAAAELAGLSLLDMGARIVAARGERVSWGNRATLADSILRRDLGGLHTTADFPALLTGAGQRVLMEAYQAAASPLKNVAKRRDAVDFRAIGSVRLSEAPRLLKVNEAGEVSRGSRSETKETFRVQTYARIFGISRNAIINDDLGAFADSAVAWGRAAAETEAEEMVALLTLNGGDGPNLDDGAPVFQIARGNRAAVGNAIDVGRLSAGRLAMRETKGLDGQTIINVAPKYLLVGAAKETEAEQALAAVQPTEAGSVNPFAGKLTLQVEPRLTGNAWRLFADPAIMPMLVYAYLNGSSGPQLGIRDGWSTLGVEFRAVLDFGCGFTDWRGAYLNPGD